MLNNTLLTATPQLPEGSFHKEIESFHIITHPSRPSWAVINKFGWEILQQCNGRNSINDIINTIKYQYDISDSIIRDDVATFIQSVTKSGIMSNDELPAQANAAAIKSAFLHLTDTCNLHCKHCYAHNMSEGNPELTDKELTSFVEKFYEAGGKALVISGGEPLLRKNFKNIFEINPEAHFILLTNATLIDENYASFLARFNVSIQVSIDGATAGVHDSIRGNGAFHAAMKGIEHLQRCGLQNKINLCTTVMQQNINDLPNIFALASSLGIPFVRFLPLRRKGNARTNWQDIQGEVSVKDYEQFYTYVFKTAMRQYPELDIRCGLSGFIVDPKKLMDDGHWCPIGKNIIIDTRGNVYPCSLLINDRFKIGNIKENTFNDILKHPTLLELMAARNKRKDTIEKCKTCMWKNFCQSSCLGSVFEQQGTIWDTDEFCDFRIRLYEQSVIKLAHNRSSATPPMPIGDTTEECF